MKRTLPILIGLLTVLGTVLAPAQTGPANTAADLRVQIVLKNGSAITGVATGGALLERQVRNGYEVAQDRSERASGIRLWYYRNLDGFLFIPYRTVRDVKVLGVLSPQESRILRETASRAKQEQARSATSGDGKAAPAGAAKDEALGPPTAEESALLLEFPPEKGWSPLRYGDIQRRKIVTGDQPTGAESRFVEVFPAWDQALRKQKAQAADAPTSPEAKPASIAPPDKEPPPSPGKAAPGSGG